jgi:hypothetical protein
MVSRAFAILSLFLFFSALCCAQVNDKGRVEIIQDHRISILIEKHAFVSENSKPQGYRVQIFSDSGTQSKSRANNLKSRFEEKYSEIPAYLSFQSPNYRVRVGDFRTRLDAEGFKAGIIGDFTDAFVVKDEIHFPEL